MEDRERKNDFMIGELLGEFREYKKEAIAWREETNERLTKIDDFISDIKTPHRIFVWALRALAIAVGGWALAAVADMIRTRIHFG